jgi:hypothetical protein
MAAAAGAGQGGQESSKRIPAAGALADFEAGLGMRFSAHYRDLYGERWPALASAMLEPQRYVARLNRLAPPGSGAQEVLEGMEGCAPIMAPQ